MMIRIGLFNIHLVLTEEEKYVGIGDVDWFHGHSVPPACFRFCVKI